MHWHRGDPGFRHANPPGATRVNEGIQKTECSKAHGECPGNQGRRPPRLYPWADTGPWVLTHVLRPSVALPGIGPPGAPTPEVMRAGKRDAFAATLSPFRPTVECAVGRH